jgi:Domain of unknown function (DUF4157)
VAAAAPAARRAGPAGPGPRPSAPPVPARPGPRPAAPMTARSRRRLTGPWDTPGPPGPGSGTAARPLARPPIVATGRPGGTPGPGPSHRPAQSHRPGLFHRPAPERQPGPRPRSGPAPRPPAPAGGPAATPEARFRAALAERPLEPARPLPGSVLPLARAVTGRSQVPHYTTGPATRHALRAAGALGATTGSVVHLPAPPSADRRSLGVLAHELSHVAERAPAPRFLLGSLGGAVDEGERRARQVGAAVGTGTLGAAGAAPGALGAVLAGSQVTDLPVGGGAAMAGAVRQAVAGPLESAAGVAAATGERAAGLAPPALPAPGDTVAAMGAAAAVGSAAAAAGPAASALAAGPPGAPMSHGQVSELLEALEDRLLAEIERRGGRYAGVF